MSNTHLLTTMDGFGWGEPIESAIYHLLVNEGPMTLGNLASQFHVPRMTLFSILSRLMARRLVKLISDYNQSHNCPLIRYQVVKD